MRHTARHMGRDNRTAGQSLVEVIIGATVGALIIGSAALLMNVVLRASSQDRFIRAATALAEDASEKVTALAGGSWRNIYDLERLPRTYNLVPQPNGIFSSERINQPPDPPPYVAPEAVTVEEVQYLRWFGVEHVSRDPATDEIEAAYNAMNDDPSTQLLTVVTCWGGCSASETFTLKKYLTRGRHQAFVQNDWSGGLTHPNIEVTATTTNRFATASPNTITGTPEEIRLQ